MLNPVLNTAYHWEFINTLILGAQCMIKLYYADNDLNKRDLLVTKQMCLDLVIDEFNDMQLTPEC